MGLRVARQQDAHRDDALAWELVRRWPDMRGEDKLAWQFLWARSRSGLQQIVVTPTEVGIDQGTSGDAGRRRLKGLEETGLINVVERLRNGAWRIDMESPLDVARRFKTEWDPQLCLPFIETLAIAEADAEVPAEVPATAATIAQVPAEAPTTTAQAPALLQSQRGSAGTSAAEHPRDENEFVEQCNRRSELERQRLAHQTPPDASDGASVSKQFGTPPASRVDRSIINPQSINPIPSAFDRSDRSEVFDAGIEDRTDRGFEAAFFDSTVGQARQDYEIALRTICARLGSIPDLEQYTARWVALAWVLCKTHASDAEFQQAVSAASNGKKPWACLFTNVLKLLTKIGPEICRPRGLWRDDGEEAACALRFKEGDGASLPELLATLGLEWRPEWVKHLWKSRDAPGRRGRR